MKTLNFSLLRLVGLSLGLFCALTPVEATPILYVSTQGNGTTGGSCPTGTCGSAIGTVDFAGGVLGSFFNVSGLSTGEEIFDIAVNSAGEIYGTSATRLYRITPTGVATLIGTHGGAGLNPLGSLVGGGTFNGLAFLGTTLYAVGNSGYLFVIDTGTGVATATHNTAFGFQSNGDIGVVGGRLFLGTTTNQIVELDPFGNVLNTGVAGLGAGIAGIKGLAGSGGDLYAVSSCNSSGCSGFENLTRINITPGGSFGTVGASSLWGGNGLITAAGLPGGMSEFVAVPEPATYFVSALGLGLIALAQRRRKQS